MNALDEHDDEINTCAHNSVELRADDEGIVSVCLDCGAELGLTTLRAIDDA
jgi:hypothetical protein